MEQLLKRQIQKHKKSKNIVTVIWSDIKTYTNSENLYLEVNNLEELLEEVESYGKILAYDDNVIALVSEISSGSSDFTIIPISLIKKIKTMKGGK